MKNSILKLLNERYFLENETCWDDIAKRVSVIYPPIYDYIRDMKFIPSSPTLMNANTNGKRKGTLSSCFTMGIEDSIDGIFDSLKEAALVTKAAGGVGYVFSNLRSSGENIESIQRESSGPVPFMKIFNSMLDGVSQGGARKGAGMCQFDIYHPDILNVIRLKSNKGEMERLNISIRIPDRFYETLKTSPNTPHFVSNVNSNVVSPLMDKGKVVSTKHLWDEIIEYAYLWAEPGIFNVDIAWDRCTLKNTDKYILSNPCLVGDTKVMIMYNDNKERPSGELDNLTIKELSDRCNNGESFYVKDLNGDWILIDSFRKTGKSEILTLTLISTIDENFSTIVQCTKYHKFVNCKNDLIEVKNLKCGDVIRGDLCNFKLVKVKSVIGLHDVYCCTVPNTHTFTLTNRIISGNCSEYIAPPYNSCNLASINLSSLVVNGEFDWIEFGKIIDASVRFLDNIMDVNEFPLDIIDKTTKQNRPIGLGTMGLSHALYKMRIPFNSEKANRFIDRLYFMLTMVGMIESVQIAKEKGSYSSFDYDIFVDANRRFFERDDTMLPLLKQYGIRNSCISSVAPNGSIGFLANTSGGIEPVFALTYCRKIEKQNKEYEEVFISDPIFEEYLNENFDEKTKFKILKQVSEDKGSCQKVKEIPEEMRKVFVVACDLTPMEHLESLAIIAKHISLGVSKTINMPSSATREEISEVYLKAHEMGVIGVTVYRDGCREGILVHKTDKDNNEKIVRNNAPKRPKKLPCHVYRVNALNRITQEGEKWIIFVGLLDDEPYEVIAGKINGTDFSHDITEGVMVKIKRDNKTIYQFAHNGEILVDDVREAFLNELREYSTRLMSLALRHGCGIEYLIDVLQKSNGTMVDYSKSIIKALRKYIKETKVKERCPLCNSELRYSESCIKCSSPDCSYTKCG